MEPAREHVRRRARWIANPTAAGQSRPEVSIRSTLLFSRLNTALQVLELRLLTLVRNILIRLRLDGVERRVVREAQALILSDGFRDIQEAARDGVSHEAIIGDRPILFEPDLPPDYFGMTLSEERGFVLGPAAFASSEQLHRTVLQELYRLTTGQAGGGATPLQIAAQTRSAMKFVERAWPLLRPRRTRTTARRT